MSSLNFKVNREAEGSISDQIAEQVRDAIKKGQLKPGDLLPSTPSVAKELGISIESVRRAYMNLREEGALETDSTNGTLVSGGKREASLASKAKPAAKRATKKSAGRRKSAKKARRSKKGSESKEKGATVENQALGKKSRAAADRAAQILRQQDELEQERKQAIAELLEEKKRIDEQLKLLGHVEGVSRRGRPKGSTSKRKRGRPRKDSSATSKG
jgi:DNA-binding transcriptional regulator YhcF (GntR family)